MGFDFEALKKPSVFEWGLVVKKIITAIPITGG
jgi:hypothetical protein